MYVPTSDTLIQDHSRLCATGISVASEWQLEVCTYGRTESAFMRIFKFSFLGPRPLFVQA